MISEKIKPSHLSRVAYVYVRQSSTYQVEHHLESQRRQYQLADKAREMGFSDIQVIDEDLGVSASASSDRSGFKKLVAEVGLNRVGIILGLEVSRFARNNRDWYHLLDLCALFDTLIADQDGVYNPGHPNDRMVMGLKGTISEAEINILKNRMLEGARNKAKRGELIYRVPVGFIKTEEQKIEKDPDTRVQQVISQAFAKFRECHSIRQTLLWFVEEGIEFPSIQYDQFGKGMVWKRPAYNAIHKVLTNPTYAGAYAYGRYRNSNKLEGDQIKKCRQRVAMKDWQVLIKDHHPGYISWHEFEQNLAIIEGNAKMMGRASPGPILKGESLLAGLLRCKRCGRKLDVSYGGKDGKVPHYSCRSARLMRGEQECIRFGGMRVDAAVSQEVLKVVQPLAIEASLKAIHELNNGISEQKKLVGLELESAEYEADRAYRQYNQVEPENRLVCTQLEAKWNASLAKVQQIKTKLQSLDKTIEPLTEQQRQRIVALSVDLPELWNSPSTTNEMRKMVIRAVIEEIICDVDAERSMILLNVHWKGGVHTLLEVKKNRTGEHSGTTDESTVELIRQLAKQLPDKAIAPILNRLKIKTGKGNTWTRDRVRTLRSYYQIPAYDRRQQPEVITLKQASEKLGICAQSVVSLIKQRVICAEQVVPCAPWMVPCQELEKQEVKNAVERIKAGSNHRNQFSRCDNQLHLFQ